MLTFESLLVKELQKQQSRAELCDIVLHTQGVSVPVHSCVLSAFSPWLRGALSTVPSSGQKRLIEIQAKEACTLLSLVTLLYSGQFNEDKDEVLSVACKLGINIPQQDTTAGSKSHLGKAESESQTGTQTEHTKELVERECQTEILCTATMTLPSECPKDTVETVNVIDLSSWRSDQGLDPYSTLSDITLTTFVQGVPEKLPFCQAMDGVPENSMYPTEEAPPIKRQRGRPPKCALPRNSAQCKMSSSELKASNPPAAFLMHTAALPAANQMGLVQPLDWLIDDVIAQLPFMPPITSGAQEGFMSTDSQPRQQTSAKIADLGMVQPQPEGELTDILDSFLRTFDQHMGACDSEVRDGMADGSQSKDPDKQRDANRHSAQNYTAHGTSGTHTRNERDLFRASSVNTTPPLGPTKSSHKRQKVSAYRPSSSCEASGVNVKKLKGRQSEKSENRRMTRSQYQKRELEYTGEGREELPAKKRRRVKIERLEKQGVETSLVNEKKRQLREMCSENKGSSCKMDSNCSITNALRKVMKMPSACSLKQKKDRSQSSEPHGHKESGLVNKHPAKTNRAKKLDKSTKNTFNDTHPKTDLSAFEMMKNLLENRRKKELQNNDDHRSCNAESQIERERGQEDSSHAKVCSPDDVTLTNFTPMPSASPAMVPALPLEESRHTQSSTDSSEEDVDVVEISSSLSESSVVQPLVADIVLSTEEDEEDAEIDVLDSN